MLRRFLFRVVFPLTLGTACLTRQNGFSFLYLVLCLLVPWIPLAPPKQGKGAGEIFLAASVGISGLILLAQTTFQIVLLSMQPYGHFLTACQFLEKILRQIGLERLDALPARDVVRLWAPDFLVFCASVGLLGWFRRLLPPPEPTSSIEAPASPPRAQSVMPQGLAQILSLAALWAAGALYPSALNGLYFVSFLAAATWWAVGRTLGKAYGVFLSILVPFVALHCLVVFAIELQVIQDLFESSCFFCSYLGLMPLRAVDCKSDPRIAQANPLPWAQFANPTAILVLYHALLVAARLSLFPPKRASALGTPAGSAVTSSSIETSNNAPIVQQDAHGSMVLAPPSSGLDPESISLRRLSQMDVAESDCSPEGGCWPKFNRLASLIGNLLARGSYVLGNVSMLAWSITFHSWLGFVLLLWSSVLWLLPNQRRAMLRTSPLLGLYTTALLLSQYIYSIDVPETDLPRRILGLSVVQLGLVGPGGPEARIKALFIKTCFTAVVWLVLRDRARSNAQAKNYSATRLPAFMSQVHSIMTLAWIWLVAGMLLLIGLVGAHMTVFRIVYMALFLLFILMFQLSYRAWRRMLYPFWILLIAYSMTLLVAVYTYQFDGFPDYWREYLHIPDTLQQDMGLQKFEAAKLFIGLLTPTFFLVITVIQVHYFHDGFMEVSDVSASSRARAASANSGASDVLLNVETNEPTSPVVEATNPVPKPGWLGLASLAKMRALGRHQGTRILYLGLLLLELHADKATALALMVASMATVRASHAVLLQLCLLAVVCSGRGLFLRIASIWTSLLVLLSMLYQMEYVDSSFYDTACSIINNDTSRDTEVMSNAEWLGFYKGATKLGAYIGFLLVATGRAILLVWQIHRRGSLSRRPTVPFPSINRPLADKDIKSCAKFLLNYAFYKFGVEACLVAIVALISVRMDLFALLHAIWLIGLFSLDRRRLSSVWRWYQIFLVISIIVQYFFAIGPPPVTCLTKFPWGDVEFLNEWLFPSNNLIICLDFVVLIFVTRQAAVFAREGPLHPGGTNEPVDLDSIVENPTPNYFTSGGSWINPVKRILFSSALWITLAVLFLAGTMRVSLFSLGYLMAAFVFLWHGEDLYLRPSALIIRKWNYLLTYNALVIALKVLMQVGACVFNEDLRKHACFLTKILSVACAQIPHLVNPAAARMDSEDTCDNPSEEIDLKWDAVCFALLIAMRRLFGSYYFAHLVNQAKAMEVLASRGAELIEHLRLQQIRQQRETERRLVDKIKSKMERIKATQAARASIGGVPEPPTHFAGTAAADAEVAAATEAAAARSTASTPGAAATATFHTPLEEEPPLGAHSPFSALHTGSLDGYLEPQRLMSWGSPPPESFPVFSPPPYGVAVRERPPGPPWMPLVTPRASLCLSSPRSHQTCDHKDDASEMKQKSSTYVNAIRSGDYYMFERIGRDDELEEPPSESEGDETEPLTISKLVSSAIRTDIDAATDLAKQQKRRASMPPGRDAQRSSYFSALSTLSAPASSVPPTAHTSPPQADSSLEPTTSPRSGLPADSSSPPDGDGDGDGDDGAGGDILPEDSPPPTPSWRSKLISYARFGWAFIESVMESSTRALNKLSRDYRYVHRVLEEEKSQLITSPSFINQGSRVGPENVWAPHYGSRPQLPEDDNPETGLIIPEIKVTRCTPGGTQPPSASGTRLPSLEELEVIEAPKRAQPAAVRLLLAIWFAIIAHSDLLCYLAVFVNQIHSASLLSIPLPLLVFFWGTLSVPRPTKTFWVTLIAYTEAIVVVKSIFQFPVFSWNVQQIADANVFYPPRLIGIYDARNLFKYDLMLLLVIFFHRYMLKSLGLWTNKDPPPLPEGLHAMDVAGDDSSESTIGVAGAAAAAAQLITPGGIALIRPRVPPPDERSPLRRPDITKYTVEKPIQEESGSGDSVCPEMALVAVAPVSIGPRRAISGWSQYIKSVKLHFSELLASGTRVSTDVYAYMFLCDFFNFLVVIFGFSSFGTQTGDGGVASYLQDNKVPIPFLVMLILQFMLIVLDRALYLRKHILGKIVFQYCLIFGVHIWMFFVLPAVTERPFTTRTLPQVWYVVKCFYLLLSAYQIRSGYPGRILGNFLCKRYNLVNMISFKIFMLIPFVFELRALMDWVWTDTSLALMDWLKMEDIFANVFQLKCGRKLEDRFPSPRGQKKGLIVKYAMGGGFLLIIIGIIWFPLVFFALGNSVGQSHPPDEIRVELRIGHYEPIYHTMILKEEGNLLSQHSSWEEFQNAFWRDRTAQTFLANYDASDVLAVQLDRASAVTWSWPEPDRILLAESLSATTAIPIRIVWNIRRSSNNPQVPDQATESLQYLLEPDDERRVGLRNLLNNASAPSLRIPALWPKFIKVTNRGTAAPITQLDDKELNAVLYPIELRLKNSSGGLWWELADPCDMHTPGQVKFDKLPFNPRNCDGGILFYTFNDKQFPATLNFLSGGGIIGLYTTLVLLAGRIIRTMLTGMSLGIMWKEWPYVDRILKLCLDIYLVRESLELALEEDLFAKLVFLYRSPETLIKWTRPKEDGEPEGEGDQQ